MSKADQSKLLASLDVAADSHAEAGWDAEIERRIEAIEAGTFPLESWSTVKRRIEQEILQGFPSRLRVKPFPPKFPTYSPVRERFRIPPRTSRLH
jgi:hypothetical protein